MKVLIKRGDWNNQVIRNKTFTMTRGLSIGQKGPFITVDATGHDTSYPQRNFRVGIANPEDMELEDPQADIFADRAKRSFQGNLRTADRN
jgi:hypothetical protein